MHCRRAKPDADACRTEGRSLCGAYFARRAERKGRDETSRRRRRLTHSLWGRHRTRQPYAMAEAANGADKLPHFGCTPPPSPRGSTSPAVTGSWTASIYRCSATCIQVGRWFGEGDGEGRNGKPARNAVRRMRVRACESASRRCNTPIHKSADCDACRPHLHAYIKRSSSASKAPFLWGEGANASVVSREGQTRTRTRTRTSKERCRPATLGHVHSQPTPSCPHGASRPTDPSSEAR